MNQFVTPQFAGALVQPAAFPSGGQNDKGTLITIFDAIRKLSPGLQVEAALLKAQRHLDHMAHHDQQTGVPNRLFLAAHLPDMLARTRRAHQSLALAFVDLDRFKHINDSWGHAAADQLLRAVAQRIRTTVGVNDLVVRMGDDEFVVVLRDVGKQEQVEAVSRRLLWALCDPFDIDGQQLVISASAGASLYPRDGANMCELLRHAGAALSRAKARGRNRWQIYSPVMSRWFKQQVSIEPRLRRAIKEQHLEVHYQPIVDIKSRQVVALESLVRWNDPAVGFVPPDDFIGVAEETGLIVPLGEFVLERVLRDIGRWRADGCAQVPVAINVSAAQLRCSNFPERLLAATRNAGLSPDVLQVELTESAAFEHPEGRSDELIEDPVMRLRELGVHVAIDDFGTRYSSLSYLKRWRVDSLKIDRAFVRDLPVDSSDLAIVASVCDMARRLKIPVVAEGVENGQQLEMLRELGCPLAQGYLFSKPVPADQCNPYLRGEPLEVCPVDARGPLSDRIAGQAGNGLNAAARG